MPRQNLISILRFVQLSDSCPSLIVIRPHSRQRNERQIYVASNARVVGALVSRQHRRILPTAKTQSEESV
ncbi:hypothetical protein LSAT2_015320 [Lamellibrachia satsuma]|nr:hypothetical protein LSAT2_015320 [Lamellibrachia satsuma]